MMLYPDIETIQANTCLQFNFTGKFSAADMDKFGGGMTICQKIRMD
jgi:hypothetical protein